MSADMNPGLAYSVHALNSPDHVEHFAVTSRSTKIRDVFALAASQGECRTEELLTLVRQELSNVTELGTQPGGSSAAWQPKHLLKLARVLSAQQIRPLDSWHAYLIFSYCFQRWGLQHFSDSDRYFASESASANRDFALTQTLLTGAVERTDPVHAHLLHANEFRPKGQMLQSTEAWGDWLQHVNSMYREAGIGTLSFAGSTPGLDALQASVRRRVDSGPLVTVIVTTYNGSRYLRTALRSLARQTWRNLEVLIVNDASLESEASAIVQIASEFPFCRVLHQARNGGGYLARNRGVSEAAGEFVTVHDDDDWSHPEKIERQVQHLLQHPTIEANMVNRVRCTTELEFTRVTGSLSLAHSDYSSLMIRRQAVVELGGWDSINRAGDSEFRGRLLSRYQVETPTIADLPLTFTRLHSQSLTSGEVVRGYVDSARTVYQASYLLAHTRAKASGGQERFRNSALKYAKPANMMPGHRRTDMGKFDRLYVIDFRISGDPMNRLIAEIKQSKLANKRIGIIHVPSPEVSPKSKLSPKLLDIAFELSVDILTLSDVAHAEELLVTSPAAIEFADSAKSSIQAARTLVVLTSDTWRASSKVSVPFDWEIVLANVDRLFRGEIELLPIDEDAAASIHNSVPPHFIADPTDRSTYLSDAGLR